ncbi:MAG: PAS domain-containing protein [Methylophaga sp.]|uniref:PAS domain-containing protein n=1 Tax=Methylophaga sp. TaxID=2024840 RepID=UPI00299D54A3|nr:PAS domain-containing protein [Methylophaga sp.]MDX1750525.1 PAS domain-containing protein [Methylophaga sp.]
MGLIIFTMIMLSMITAIVFGTWWDSTAPFKIHFAVAAAIFAALFSAVLTIAFYPRSQRKLMLAGNQPSDKSLGWANDVAKRLSTPSAVIDGFNIIFANNAFLRELGMNGMRELVTNMPLTNMVHPSNHAALTNFMRHMKTNHEPHQTLTLRMLYVDGTTIPVHISLSPLNSEGQSNLNLLQFSSITQAQNDSELKSEKFNFPSLLNNIRQIIFINNVDQEIIYANTAWEILTDFSVSESINKPFLSFIHPEDILLVESRMNSLIQGKRQYFQIECRVITKNGSYRWIEIRASRSSNFKGERSSVIGTLTDITQLKQLEAAQKHNRHSPVDMIMTNIPSMVYRCKNDRDWTFEFVSDSCLEVTEYQPYELINSNNVTYMQLIHPEDRPRCWEHVQEQIAKQRKFQMIYRICTRTNKTRWVMEQGEGIFSASGELLALEGVVIDLSNDTLSQLEFGLHEMLENRPDLIK